jgi:hypothetical protein
LQPYESKTNFNEKHPIKENCYEMKKNRSKICNSPSSTLVGACELGSWSASAFLLLSEVVNKELLLVPHLRTNTWSEQTYPLIWGKITLSKQIEVDLDGESREEAVPWDV